MEVTLSSNFIYSRHFNDTLCIYTEILLKVINKCKIILMTIKTTHVFMYSQTRKLNLGNPSLC